MIRVRRHQRQLASGKTATVRQHERGGNGSADEGGIRPDGEDDWWDRPEAEEMKRDEDPDGTWYFRDGDGDLYRVLPDGTTHPVSENKPEPADPAERELDRTRQQMREWRSRPEPVASDDEPMSPQMEKAMGCDTPEGRERYDRLRAYREAGYDGPLDRDCRIPDPDDPANHETLSALAYMRSQQER